MEHKERAAHIEITVSDILEQVKYHLKFLQEVDAIPELKTERFRELAAYRYEKYWLPLISTYPQSNLVGPLDVEWMWHCHMLAPLNYSRDCTQRVGKVIYHKLRTERDRKECQERARFLWSQMYKEEPFDVDYNEEMAETNSRIRGFQSCFSYDIVAASERQSSFYYNVSLPHYTDRRFLEKALSRYKQFLYVIKQYPDAALRPCYDIDLVWHTHMLNPNEYGIDTTVIGGGLLHHDDTLTDSGVGAQLLVAGETAMDKWKALFNETFKIAGVTKRGTPSNSCLSEINMTDVRRKVIIQTGTLCVNSIMVRGPTLKRKKLDKMIIVFKTYDQSDNQSFQLEGRFAVLSIDHNGDLCARWSVEDMCLGIEENRTSLLLFELLKKRKLFGISRDSESIFTGVKEFNSNQFSGEDTHDYQFEKALAKYTLQINASFTPHKKRIDFILNVGEFSERKTPEEIERFFNDGTEDHEFLPYMKETSVAAQHNLRNLHENSNMSVNVFHSARLLTSRIQVKCRGKVVVVAELISTDQLPLPNQVDSDVPTLDPTIGERAVLIKNNKGDWAVVVGKWVGYTRGKEGKTFQRCIINFQGENVVQEYHLSKRTENKGSLEYQIYLLPSCEKLQSLPDHLKVNFCTGDIQIFDQFKEVAENIGLALSVALLHVLCKPRKRSWTVGDPTEDSRHNKILVAAGLNVLTPSNHYITTHLGRHVCQACGFGDPLTTEHTTDDDEVNVADFGVGYDGCVGDIAPSVCMGVDVKEDEVFWRNVGRKENDGSITPVRKCGRFAKTCGCNICDPPPPEPYRPPGCHCQDTSNYRCRLCSCGPMCMHP